MVSRGTDPHWNMERRGIGWTGVQAPSHASRFDCAWSLLVDLTGVEHYVCMHSESNENNQQLTTNTGVLWNRLRSSWCHRAKTSTTWLSWTASLIESWQERTVVPLPTGRGKHRRGEPGCRRSHDVQFLVDADSQSVAAMPVAVAMPSRGRAHMAHANCRTVAPCLSTAGSPRSERAQFLRNGISGVVNRCALPPRPLPQTLSQATVKTEGRSEECVLSMC